MSTRRQLLTGAGLAAAATSLGLAGCSSSGGGTGSATGEATLQFAWWGNPLRNKQTDEAIKAYTTANPKVTIKPQPGEWQSYWDKLATQVAGNTAPDVIQMDMAYISEYGARGALLDLTKYVDVSKFAPGTADAGKVNDKLVGINAGVNTLVLFCNPKVLKAAGVSMPDDKSWTWEDYKNVSAEIAGKGPSGTTGTAVIFDSRLLQIWLRQNGKDLFTADGKLGFTATDIVPYYQMMMGFEKAKAIPSPSAITEDAAKTLDQQSFAQGTQGFALFWSNQLAAVSQAAGTTITMLRPPSVAGNANERKAWYKASMLWSASSRTKNPDAVGKLISWWVNDPACANICLDERGIPANTDIVSEIKSKLSEIGKTVAKFIADIEPELGDSPVAPPPGGGKIGDVTTRHATDMLFGRATVADACDKIVAEATANLQQ